MKPCTFTCESHIKPYYLQFKLASNHIKKLFKKTMFKTVGNIATCPIKGLISLKIETVCEGINLFRNLR